MSKELFNAWFQLCTFRAITNQLKTRNLINEAEESEIIQEIEKMEDSLISAKSNHHPLD